MFIMLILIGSLLNDELRKYRSVQETSIEFDIIEFKSCGCSELSTSIHIDFPVLVRLRSRCKMNYCLLYFVDFSLDMISGENTLKWFIADCSIVVEDMIETLSRV